MATTVFSPLGGAKGTTFHYFLALHTHARTKWPQCGDAKPFELRYAYTSALHKHTLTVAMPRHGEAMFWQI